MQNVLTGYNTVHVCIFHIVLLFTVRNNTTEKSEGRNNSVYRHKYAKHRMDTEKTKTNDRYTNNKCQRSDDMSAWTGVT
jgi:prolipoprotein diacylglyceryltransferase